MYFGANFVWINSCFILYFQYPGLLQNNQMRNQRLKILIWECATIPHLCFIVLDSYLKRKHLIWHFSTIPSRNITKTQMAGWPPVSFSCVCHVSAFVVGFSPMNPFLRSVSTSLSGCCYPINNFSLSVVGSSLIFTPCPQVMVCELAMDATWIGEDDGREWDQASCELDLWSLSSYLH
jgi:hypothetical protein